MAEGGGVDACRSGVAVQNFIPPVLHEGGGILSDNSWMKFAFDGIFRQKFIFSHCDASFSGPDFGGIAVQDILFGFGAKIQHIWLNKIICPDGFLARGRVINVVNVDCVTFVSLKDDFGGLGEVDIFKPIHDTLDFVNSAVQSSVN